MSERERALIEVEIERVPDIDGDDWVQWCGARGLSALNGGRRAWIDHLNTYLRDANYLVYFQGALVAVTDSSELLPVGGKAL